MVLVYGTRSRFFLEVPTHLIAYDRVFLRGAPGTLMVPCASLLQSRAATSQVTFKTSGFIWAASGSSRKSERCKCRVGSVLLAHGADLLWLSKVRAWSSYFPEDLGESGRPKK